MTAKTCYGLIDEFSTEHLGKLSQRFKDTCDEDGSTVGFLHKDDDLLDLYNKDLQLLDSYGITFQQVADVLQNMIEKYKRKKALISDWDVNFDHRVEQLHKKQIENLSDEILNMRCNGGYDYYNFHVKSTDPIVIDDRYVVTSTSFWGFQICPFIGGLCTEEDFVHIRDEMGGGNDYWIHDIETRQSLKFNDLHIHLVRDHGFFEGHVYHRLEPLDVVTFFSLQSGIDYSPRYLYENRWLYINEGGDISPCYQEGETTIVEIKSEDNHLLVDTKQIRKDDKYYETMQDGIQLKHRLSCKKVSKYKKKSMKYVKIQDEIELNYLVIPIESSE
jgi:hypothetical protein